MRSRFSVLVLCLVVAAAAGQQPVPDDTAWEAFLQWLNQQLPNSNPEDLIPPYRAVLLRRGLTPAEADRLMSQLGHRAFTDPAGAKVLWNKVYAGAKPIFNLTPNGFLAKIVDGRTPGTALDVGMGQGRNAVFLAQRGWSVTGIDPSDEAVRLAEQSAQAAGVRITAVAAADSAFDFGSARWDLIVVTYVRDLDGNDARRIWRALKPGGILVYENGASPKNEVLRAFLDFQILHFEDADDTPDWHPERRTRIQRLAAQKPESR